MESWGCEFLDLEKNHEVETFKKKIYHLPVSLVEKTVNEETAFKIISKDMDYVYHLRLSINQNGLEYPGLLIFATNGVLLQDGNHRFFAVKDTFSTFPVEIRITDKPLRIKGAQYNSVISEFLEFL